MPSKMENFMKKSQNTLLNNRWLLYFILFLAIVDLYVYAVNGELLFVGIFIAIGYLTSFFSKNMMVILFIAIVLTNILKYGKGVRLYEGMETGTGESSTETVSDGDIKPSTNTTDTTTSVTNKEEEGGDDQYLDPDKKKKKAADVKATTVTSEDTPKKIDTTELNTKLANLDEETAQLLMKQQKLMENMQNLNPLLKKAENFLNVFKMD